MSLGVDCPDLKDIKLFYVEINNNLIPHFIESASVRGDKAFIKLEDVNTQEAASQLKGSSLYLPKTERPKLPKGEFYSEEIIDFEVIDNHYGSLGTVREVHENGPNKHIIVAGSREVMIPTNAPFIKSINKSRKEITIELPEGFLEI